MLGRGAHATNRLCHPALAELGHHGFGYLLHLVARGRRWRGLAIARRASACWRIDHAEVAHDALQNVLQFLAIDLLLVAQRLAALAKIEAAQLGRGAESFGEIG